MTYVIEHPPPPSTTLSQTAWRRAWKQAIRHQTEFINDLAKAHKIVSRDQYLVYVPEAQPWGTVIWRTDLDGSDLCIDRLIVAAPDHSVRLAHREARSQTAPRIAALNGSALPGDGVPLAKMAATGGGLFSGVALASAVASMTPGPWPDIALAAGAGLLGMGAHDLVTRRRQQQCRTIHSSQYGHAPQLVAEMGVRLDVSDELAAMVLPDLRDILWDADHAGRGQTIDRLQRLHKAVVRTMPDPAVYAEKKALSERRETPRQVEKRLRAAVEKERRDQHSEYVDGRLNSTIEWLYETAPATTSGAAASEPECDRYESPTVSDDQRGVIGEWT